MTKDQRINLISRVAGNIMSGEDHYNAANCVKQAAKIIMRATELVEKEDEDEQRRRNQTEARD